MYKQIAVFFITLFLTRDMMAYEKIAGNVIVDKDLGIYWQDDFAAGETSEDWADSVDYCKKLKLGNLVGWRLPTFQELFSIVDYTKYKPAINSAFESVTNDRYWTQTPFATTDSRAWNINFGTGETYYSYKTTNQSVRCVKDIK